MFPDKRQHDGHDKELNWMLIIQSKIDTATKSGRFVTRVASWLESLKGTGKVRT